MKISSFVPLALLLGLVLLGVGCKDEQDEAAKAELAQCLSSSGFTMYGAFWCPHCVDQKKLFGDAFEFVDYVECDPRDPEGKPEVCLDHNVKTYPTWIFKDGRRWEGRQSLDTLAQVAACSWAGEVDPEGS